MNYAPIALFVYNRPWHTKQTIEALQKNELADQSELFIFSDGPKNKTDAIEVQNVRKYIKTVTGFKTITIVEKETNSGLADSIVTGVTEIIGKYGKIIVLEDDLVSAPGFLNFLNDGLEFYQVNLNIFCITGYNFPPTLMKIQRGYPHDIYISPRNGSWGWATWKDRWNKADWDILDYKQFSQNKHLQKEFDYGGEDLSTMLKSQMEGDIDSWSIRWCYCMFKNNGYCIYPIQSFIDNIGCDGTGAHCGEDKVNRWKNFKLNQEENIHFPEIIDIDDGIMKQFQGIFKRKNLLFRVYQYCERLSSNFLYVKDEKF
jgi:hypothetical protein